MRSDALQASDRMSAALPQILRPCLAALSQVAWDDDATSKRGLSLGVCTFYRRVGCHRHAERSATRSNPGLVQGRCHTPFVLLLLLVLLLLQVIQQSTRGISILHLVSCGESGMCTQAKKPKRSITVTIVLQLPADLQLAHPSAPSVLLRDHHQRPPSHCLIHPSNHRQRSSEHRSACGRVPWATCLKKAS